MGQITYDILSFVCLLLRNHALRKHLKVLHSVEGPMVPGGMMSVRR